MSLKNKVSLLLLSGYLLLLVILLVQRFAFSIPELKELQRQSDFNEVERIVKALEYQQLEISRFTYDYGVWDDTFDYVNSRDQAYIESNFIEDTFDSLGINGIYIFDVETKIIWSASYFGAKSWVEDAEIFAKEADLYSLAFSGLDKPVSEAVFEKGIMKGRYYPILFSSVSILPSKPEGVPRGTYSVVRALTPDVVGQLSETAQLEFELFLFKDVGNNKELAAIAPKLDVLKAGEVYRSNGYGYRWLRSDGGEPIALLKVNLSDAIYNDELFDASTILVLVIATLTMLLVRTALGVVVIKPLEITRNHMKKVRETSNYSLKLENHRADEIGELSRECDSLVHYVNAQEQYLREINQDLTKKTLEDGLTEVANRRHFDVKLELFWRAFKQKKQPIFLILIDVDNFKAYNDNYGHLKGDEALKSIADVLLSSVRVNTDMVARYGGEEFAILLSETDITGIKVVCDKLLSAIRTLNIPHEYSDAASRVTVSMGVSGWIPDSDEAITLVKSADEALYEAKAAGKDCVQFHIRDDSISR